MLKSFLRAGPVWALDGSNLWILFTVSLINGFKILKSKFFESMISLERPNKKLVKLFEIIAARWSVFLSSKFIS